MALPTIIGQLCYLTWRMSYGGHENLLGTDTFCIQNGKIKFQTATSDLFDFFPIKQKLFFYHYLILIDYRQMKRKNRSKGCIKYFNEHKN